MDPTAQFKEQQKAAWSSFALFESMTGTVAPRLVSFAGIKAGAAVLDVGCGTGVVGLTAARLGARVTGVDLTPELIARAKENSALTGLEVDWRQGDAEALPAPDASFDFVVSQFGHMFAPRPDVALAEMRRVLKPDGRIAFATWPPEHFVGRFFALVSRNSPPPPPGAAPPPLWGSVPVVSERLSEGFEAPFFGRGVMLVPALSLGHFWEFMSASVGPLQKLVERLAGDPDQLAAVRQQFIDLAEPYYDGNLVHQHYLLTRAQAR